MKYIEIIFCLIEVAVQISEPVGQNFIRYRTCYVTLGYNETECARLGTKEYDNKTEELERATHPYVTVLNMSRDLTDAFISVFMCLFLGSWSDKYGRRPVLLFALSGYLVSYTISSIVVAIPNLSPWFLILNTIPLGLTGGFPIVLSSTISYISDTTVQEHKGVRMGVFEVTLTLAAMIGTAISSFIFSALGYLTVYLITTIILLISLYIMAVFIPESIADPQPIQQCRIKDVLNWSLIKETATITFKQRPNYDRGLLLLLVCIIVAYFLVVTGDDKIVFLYFSTKLRWSLEKYTLYLTARKLVWITGSLVGIFIFHKWLHIKESVLLSLGMLSMMTSALLQGIGFVDWHIYLAGASRCFGGVISPMARSLVSKVILSEDTGKVFSFIVILETLIQFVGRPIYTYTYNHTLNTLPGAFNFITVGIYCLETILTILLGILQYRRQDVERLYENLVEDSTNEHGNDGQRNG